MNLKLPHVLILLSMMFTLHLQHALADPGAMTESQEVISKRIELHRLHRAVRSGDKVEIRKILDSGVDVDQTAAMRLAITMEREDIVDLLLDHGTGVDQPGIGGELPLEIAIQQNRGRMVRHLLGKGANVNHRNQKGKTLIEVAAERGRPELVNMLKMHTAAQGSGPRNGMVP